MASPANMNGQLPFPKPAGPQSPVPGHGPHSHPGSYIPRGASIDPSHERNRDFGSNTPSHPHEHVSARSGNNSPVAGSQSSGKPQTVFIHKLYDMLEDASLSHLIWWSASQDSFCLYPGEEFSNVLAQYFKHTNIASFIRQLNMYGFHKVNDNFQPEEKHHNCSQVGHCEGTHPPPASQQTRWEFRHTANHFRKGDVDSLNLIKRKSSKVISSHKEIVSLKTLPPTSEAPRDDLKQMRDSPTPEQYHSSVYQQSWNQMGVHGGRAVSASAGKEHSRQQGGVYAGHAGPPAIMGQYPYPVYAQQVGLPHSPSSPSLQDPSPSYFLHSPSHPQAHSHSQPHSQPTSRQTSVQTPAISLEATVNFRLIELGTTVTGLKAAYSDLHARHEALAAMYHKGQADLLQLAEIVEKLTKAPDHAQVDRALARTPVNRAVSPSQDSMSPTTVKPPKSADLASFKSSLQSKLHAPPDAAKSHSSKQPAYHLGESSSVSAASATARGVSGIVPQQYPLNPNYTLYNTPEGALRPALGLETGARPAPLRQVSVLMDPLQPAPQSIPTRGAAHPQKQAPEAAGQENAPAKDDKQVPSYVQQYQPFAPAHAYYQQMVQDQSQLRTSSLPVMSHPLPQRLDSGTPQRHSLTTLVHYKNERDEEKSAHTSRPVTAKPEESPRPLAKKQLPSMEELNKSLRTGPASGPMFGLHSANESEEDSAKRRKIEE